MKLEYLNQFTLELGVDGFVSLNAAGMHWETRQGFAPSITVQTDGEHRQYCFTDSAEISQQCYQTGYSRGIRTIYKGFPFHPDFSFATFAEYQTTTGQLKAGIIPLCDPECGFEKLAWPGPMEFSELRQNHYTVYPLQQGALIPNGWAQAIDLHSRWELDADYMYSRSAYMPWFGQVREKEGYWFLVNTPFDAGFSLEHPANGACHVGVVWLEQLGKLGYTRECTLTFLPECDYNLFAKLFRKHLKETGELCTLKEKVLKNPGVQNLLGTSIYHDGIYRNIQPESFYYRKDEPEYNEHLVTFAQMEDRLKQMHERGVRQMFVHLDGWPREGYDNQHPDPFPPCEKAGGWEGMRSLCRTAQALGYQFAIHDQYRDYFLRAPSYDPEYSIKNRDGKADGCTIWFGGKQEYLCPDFYPGFVKRNFTQMLQGGVPLDGAYLDVFSCMHLDECFAPLHPVTRERCMQKRKEALDYVRSLGIIISSEEGVGWAMRDLDLVHHAPYVYDALPDPTQICGQMLPETIGVPVPLLNLVYHDCVVTPWTMSSDVNHQSGFLHALLNGGVVYVSLNQSEQELAEAMTAADLHKAVGFEEMLKHEFVTPDGQVQRTTFANGTAVTVDFTKNTYEITGSSLSKE